MWWGGGVVVVAGEMWHDGWHGGLVKTYAKGCCCGRRFGRSGSSPGAAESMTDRKPTASGRPSWNVRPWKTSSFLFHIYIYILYSSTVTSLDHEPPLRLAFLAPHDIRRPPPVHVPCPTRIAVSVASRLETCEGPGPGPRRCPRQMARATPTGPVSGLDVQKSLGRPVGFHRAPAPGRFTERKRL